MKNEITFTMKVCSKYARRVPCVRCLHYKKCLSIGGCCTRLGLYMSYLIVTALPPIEAELKNLFFQGLKLVVCDPSTNEIKNGAYVVVRVYKNEESENSFVRVPLTGEEAEYQIKSLLFEAISKAIEIKKGRK